MFHRHPNHLPTLLVATTMTLVGACSEEATTSDGTALEEPGRTIEAYSAGTEAIEKTGENDPRNARIFDVGVAGKTAAEVSQVLELAQAEPQLPAVQLEAISALEFIGKHVPDEAALACGAIMDQAKEPVVRIAGAEALEFIGGRKATDILLDHLQDASGDVRHRVADALEFMVEPGDFPLVQAAFEAEVDRAVKAEIFELIENIELDRRRLEAEKTKALGDPV